MPEDCFMERRSFAISLACLFCRQNQSLVMFLQRNGFVMKLLASGDGWPGSQQEPRTDKNYVYVIVLASDVFA